MPASSASTLRPRVGISGLVLAACWLLAEGCGECIDCSRLGPDPAYARVTVLDTSGALVAGVRLEAVGTGGVAACPVTDAAGRSTCTAYLEGGDSLAAWIRAGPGLPYHPDSALTVFRRTDTVQVVLSIGG